MVKFNQWKRARGTVKQHFKKEMKLENKETMKSTPITLLCSSTSPSAEQEDWISWPPNSMTIIEELANKQNPKLFLLLLCPVCIWLVLFCVLPSNWFTSRATISSCVSYASLLRLPSFYALGFLSFLKQSFHNTTYVDLCCKDVCACTCTASLTSPSRSHYFYSKHDNEFTRILLSFFQSRLIWVTD